MAVLQTWSLTNYVYSSAVFKHGLFVYRNSFLNWREWFFRDFLDDKYISRDDILSLYCGTRIKSHTDTYMRPVSHSTSVARIELWIVRLSPAIDSDKPPRGFQGEFPGVQGANCPICDQNIATLSMRHNESVTPHRCWKCSLPKFNNYCFMPVSSYNSNYNLIILTCFT